VKQNLKRWRLARLRHCVGAGEPLNPEVINAWHEAYDLMIHDGYGQTETTALAANLPGMPIRPGSMGKPFPGHDVRVIDEQGNEVEPGQIGELALRGRPPSLFREYWKSPADTAAARRGDWHLTGDRARRDEDGYLWFIGRADDVIISAGYRIGPFEVESALLEHPAVVESAVVASPDAVRGEVVKAFVVVREGHAPGEELVRALQDHVKKVTAPYKYPREIEFVDSLPKTVSGKIRRVELRERERKVKATAAPKS
jgi:acetyl-CoA synthetase/medium-chain acyl-CoA synthetase